MTKLTKQQLTVYYEENQFWSKFLKSSTDAEKVRLLAEDVLFRHEKLFPEFHKLSLVDRYDLDKNIDVKSKAEELLKEFREYDFKIGGKRKNTVSRGGHQRTRKKDLRNRRYSKK